MSTTTEPIAQTGTPGQQGSEGQGGAPATQPQAGNDQQDKTFSQQAVNALIGSRLKEARAQWEKEQRDAAETAEAEKRGEYEKVLTKERERADRVEADLKAERDGRMRDRAHHAVQVAARDLGFADPDDAFRFLETEAVEWDANGNPTNIKALLDKLAKDKPYLLGGTAATGTAPIPRTPNGTQITREQFHAQEKERALRSGKYSPL